MKKPIIVLLMAALFLCLTACTAQQEAKTDPEGSSSQQAAQKLRHVEITIRDYGVVKLELYPELAPITVANFIQLSKKGFYDGLTFHRIIDGFMIQGGAPRSNSSDTRTITGEFSENGWTQNTLRHEAGVISMARANDPNSASSQFFICVGPVERLSHLDGKYAAFGRVTEGLEIAQKIAADARPTDNNGSIAPDQQPVIEKIVVID